MKAVKFTNIIYNLTAFIVILIYLSLCPRVYGYLITSSVIGDGGGSSSGSGYILKCTAGEEAVRIMSGTGYNLHAGFWYTVAIGTVADTVPPSTPVLTSPLNDSWTTNQAVVFTWERATDSSGISKYEFRAALSPDFSPLTTFYTNLVSTYTSAALNYGRYYWSARAYDNNNNPGAWASPWSVLVSSRVWRLYLSADADELVADNSHGVNIYASFAEPSGSTAPLSGYNYPLTLMIRCGDTVRRSSDTVTQDGIARFYYQDSVAGKMTVETEYDDFLGAKTINNLVPAGMDCTVWCADDDGKTRLTCPANTFSGNAWINISVIGSDLGLSQSLAVKCLPNSARAVTASIGQQVLGRNDFNHPVTLSIPYSQSGDQIEGVEIQEGILNLYRLTGLTPGQLISTVDTVNNRVSADLDYLSTYFIGFVVPTVQKLYPNFPNPFTAGEQVTCIMYELTRTAAVSVKIFNLGGELIKTIVNNEEQSGGQYKVYWDGANEAGTAIAQGIYVCLLETPDKKSMIKIAVKKQQP